MVKIIESIRIVFSQIIFQNRLYFFFNATLALLKLSLDKGNISSRKKKALG